MQRNEDVAIKMIKADAGEGEKKHFA